MDHGFFGQDFLTGIFRPSAENAPGVARCWAKAVLGNGYR